ncbi:MAG: DUF885 domain-containing protein [Rubrivivax sp.]
MNVTRRAAGLTLAGALAGLGDLPARAAEADPHADPDITRRLHALFDRQWQALLQRLPELATFLGDHRFDDRLADLSPAALAADETRTRQWLAEAKAIPREALAPADRVSLDMFVGARERELALQPFTGFRSLRVGVLGGAQSDFASLMQATRLETKADVGNLMKRFAALPARMDQEIALMRGGLAQGWVPARPVLERVLAQIDGQVSLALDESPYFDPFRHLGREIPEAERPALQAAGRAAIEREVIPSLRKLRAFVADEYLPKAPADGALRHLPGGAQVYEVLVRQQTTTPLPAAEIHAIGQRELKRLRAEMEATAKAAKFDGDFAAFVQFLNTDRRFFFDSGEALLAGYRDIAKRIDAELPRLFAELPRLPYGVRAIPAFRGPDVAEYYSGPDRDGTRPGWFNANTTGFAKKPKWEMATLVAHEAVPGHHLQVARGLELRNLPEFRRGGFGYTAFVEGWALYAETLGFEMGLYEDPYARFGHLQWQAFRAARLVVDTGLHALGWTRQQAIDFMVERTGVDRGFVSEEVDRYLSTPAQALSYMIGELKIVELRDRAKAALGPKFDLRRFHNAVIDQGALPLDTLERVIDEWVAAQR